MKKQYEDSGVRFIWQTWLTGAHFVVTVSSVPGNVTAGWVEYGEGDGWCFRQGSMVLTDHEIAAIGRIMSTLRGNPEASINEEKPTEEEPTRDRLLDALVDMVSQHCAVRDPDTMVEQSCEVVTMWNSLPVRLDSMGLSANADAMLLLERAGKLTIEEQHGDRIIARRKECDDEEK